MNQPRNTKLIIYKIIKDNFLQNEIKKEKHRHKLADSQTNGVK